MIAGMPGPRLPASTTLLILGAGPAGLALGFELKHRGIACCLLEKGTGAGSSWATMPEKLKLVSPWKANWLPGMDASSQPANYEMAAHEYAALLQRHADLHGLQVIKNAGVETVTHWPEQDFIVRTSAGTFRSRLLVNATGCFSNPHIPAIPGARETAVPQFHFATYHNAAKVRAAIRGRNGTVLIVGKRLSAGQLLVEFVDEGFDVALSCRGPVQFGAGKAGSWLFFRILPALEQLELRWRGSRAHGFPSVMPGGRSRRLIQQGHVGMFPEIARFEERRVVFRDGSTLTPAAVIYATGFRPALSHLAGLNLDVENQAGMPALNDFESATVPGLFFLGLDRMRNFRSRFLRGIREDAPLLADELADRIQRCVEPAREAGSGSRERMSPISPCPAPNGADACVGAIEPTDKRLER